MNKSPFQLPGILKPTSLIVANFDSAHARDPNSRRSLQTLCNLCDSVTSKQVKLNVWIVGIVASQY